eukprot:COSAG01_NODE_897_length_12874_cov_17.636115_3_plen_113_part_00
MIVYDVTQRRSFENVSSWLSEVQRYAADDVCLMILGNKADLEERRAVSFQEASALAAQAGAGWGAGEHRVLFFETSAKESFNVEEAFMTLAHQIKVRRLGCHAVCCASTAWT